MRSARSGLAPRSRFAFALQEIDPRPLKAASSYRMETHLVCIRSIPREPMSRPRSPQDRNAPSLHPFYREPASTAALAGRNAT